VKIEIAERQPVKVAYLRYTGPFGEPLGKFWRHTVSPWLAEQGLLDCPRYGVALDNPLDTPPDKCRYDCCVELTPGLTLSNANETMIPGGRYATTPFKGAGSEIGAAWAALIAEILVPDRIDPQRPAFEHYPRGASYDWKTGVFSCELCIPVTS